MLQHRDAVDDSNRWSTTFTEWRGDHSKWIGIANENQSMATVQKNDAADPKSLDKVGADCHDRIN